MSSQYVENEIVSLHLGCGQRYVPFFTYHIDTRPLPHVDYVTSADKLEMFEEESVDLIYACHVLEHFGRNKIGNVLAEWYRVLKTGGVLRIAVPDFAVLTKVYQITGDLQLVLGSIVGRQDYPGNTHYIVFDYTSLSKALKEAGFRDIHRYDWRDTIHKDFDDYSQAYIPHMDKEHGTLISLNVEANK